MSIATEISLRFGHDVAAVAVNKDANLHGEAAVAVEVTLADGRTVEGTFTKEARAGFGGLAGAGPKPVTELMIAKVQSVLDGTAEVCS